MSKESFPDWFLDEAAMKLFINSGGNAMETQREKERYLERFMVEHPLQESERIGYIIVGAPIGAERMRWMFCTPEFNYMPIFLPSAGKVFICERQGKEKLKGCIQDMLKSEFLNLALEHCVILRCEGQAFGAGTPR